MRISRSVMAASLALAARNVSAFAPRPLSSSSLLARSQTTRRLLAHVPKLQDPQSELLDKIDVFIFDCDGVIWRVSRIMTQEMDGPSFLFVPAPAREPRPGKATDSSLCETCFSSSFRCHPSCESFRPRDDPGCMRDAAFTLCKRSLALTHSHILSFHHIHTGRLAHSGHSRNSRSLARSRKEALFCHQQLDQESGRLQEKV
jgi:hypothetical protein